MTHGFLLCSDMPGYEEKGRLLLPPLPALLLYYKTLRNMKWDRGGMAPPYTHCSYGTPLAEPNTLHEQSCLCHSPWERQGRWREGGSVTIKSPADVGPEPEQVLPLTWSSGVHHRAAQDREQRAVPPRWNHIMSQSMAEGGRLEQLDLFSIYPWPIPKQIVESSSLHSHQIGGKIGTGSGWYFHQP